MANPKNRQVLCVALTFLPMTWIAVSLRVLVRAGMLRAFGPDDWLMLLTQLIFTAYLACQIGGVVYGTGEHLDDLEAWRAEKALSFWYFCEIFYDLSTVLLKISVGFFLLRVASKRPHIWIIRAIMVCCAVFGTGYFFVIVFQCNPIHDWWDLNPAHKNCISPDIIIGLTYGISGLNVIADWTLALLPFWIVKDLQMSKRQKRLVAGILALAAIGSAATIVRLPYIGSLAESFSGWNGDFLYDTFGVAIWTTVEVGVGITAGCLATLRPLIRLVFARFGISSSGQRDDTAPSVPHDLDQFAPPRGRITTTITSNHGNSKKHKSAQASSSSSQEGFVMSNKIERYFVVEYDSEPAERDGGRMVKTWP